MAAHRFAAAWPWAGVPLHLLVVDAPSPYRAGEVADAVGVPLVGVLAFDSAGARVHSEGANPGRGFERSEYARSRAPGRRGPRGAGDRPGRPAPAGSAQRGRDRRTIEVQADGSDRCYRLDGRPVRCCPPRRAGAGRQHRCAPIAPADGPTRHAEAGRTAHRRRRSRPGRRGPPGGVRCPGRPVAGGPGRRSARPPRAGAHAADRGPGRPVARSGPRRPAPMDGRRGVRDRRQRHGGDLRDGPAAAADRRPVDREHRGHRLRQRLDRPRRRTRGARRAGGRLRRRARRADPGARDAHRTGRAVVLDGQPEPAPASG